jgi:hypothetical protein
MPTAADFETALHREVGAFRFDPLGFVLYAFPWGIPGRRWPTRRVPRNGRGKC